MFAAQYAYLLEGARIKARTRYLPFDRCDCFVIWASARASSALCATQLGDPCLEPFIALMRRYCIEYVARHDFSQLEHLMVEDYVLRMGDHDLVGRDGPYAHATRIQMEQLPNLMLTTHELVTNGERLAMRFSEHGAAPSRNGACASWGGISLYRWNGNLLTECVVEQDYYARRDQYARGVPDPVDSPAVAPWDVVAMPSSPSAEAAARDWLESGARAQGKVYFDDAWLPGRQNQELIDQNSIEVLDLFSAGDRVAFRAKQIGTLTGDFSAGEAGKPVYMHMAGIVTVTDGAVVAGRLVRDRMGLDRRLRGRIVKTA